MYRSTFAHLNTNAIELTTATVRPAQTRPAESRGRRGSRRPRRWLNLGLARPVPGGSP